jgi:bacillolysin
MKGRDLRGVGLFVIFLVLIFFLKTAWPDKRVVEPSKPPVEKIQAFALNAGPKSAPGKWSRGDQNESAHEKTLSSLTQALLTNGLSRVTPSGRPGARFRDSQQSEAFDALRARVGPSLQVFLRSENSTPIQIKGNPLVGTANIAGDPNTRDETAARSFLRENAALFLLNDTDQELILSQKQPDDLGGSILRFSQSYQGLEVWPSEISVHFNARSEITLVDAASVGTPSGISVTPSFPAGDVEAKVRTSVTNAVAATVSVPELLIYAPLDRQSRLAWKADVTAGEDRAWWVLIDAGSGELLEIISRVMQEGVSGSGVDILGKTRSIHVYKQNADFYMIDASKTMFNVQTGEGFIEVDDARGGSISESRDNLYYVLSTSATSWSIPDAVSASYNLSETFDYYFERFNRKSYDAEGANIKCVVRIGSYRNASWNGQSKRMDFGMADRYSASLDVIGHEFTHAVVSSIGKNGVLFYQAQSGALNESFADIFGEMIEARTQGTNDWLLGTVLSETIRNMANPAAKTIGGTTNRFPARYSELINPEDPFLNSFNERDYGGVHINSGIINRAFFLLASGLKGAVGRRDAEKIFYRCLTVSMKPLSQFIDARLGCVSAAEDLFGVGSLQAIKTAEAFDVVEIYAAPMTATQPLSARSGVDAPDSAVFNR